MAEQTAVSALMESIFGSDFRLTVSDDILNKYQISVADFNKNLMF